VTVSPVQVTVSLPFPAKALWPNGRAHWAVKAKAFKVHKDWAILAMWAARCVPAGSRVAVDLTVYPKTRHTIDADNAVSACKAYLDGIALALGVNDSTFNAPTVTFGEPVKGGLFVVTVSYDREA
jgi:crossover junction endodeoxyribonuclease RusA